MVDKAASAGFAPRYVGEFVCIAGDCPEACCLHWEVPVARDYCDQLEVLLPEEEFRQALRYLEEPTLGANAHIKLHEDGRCFFLDKPDHLCTLQKRFGSQALSRCCRQFPRHYYLVDGHQEMSMSLSCPEAARLCLLQQDSMDLIEITPDQMIEPVDEQWHKDVIAPSSSYSECLVVVRDSFLRVFGLAGLSINVRALVAACLAEEVSTYINEGMDDLDPRRLEKSVAEFIQSTAISSLTDEFLALPSEVEYPMSVILGVLAGQFDDAPTFRQLLKDILGRFGVVSGAGGLEIDGGGDLLMRVGMEYRVRNALLNKRYGSRLNTYLDNYCRNFWFGTQLLRAVSPRVHMVDMIIRMQTARFLLVCRPEVDALLMHEDIPQDALARLDALAVDTLYKFSRGIEHRYQFMQLIYEKIEEHNQSSVAHMALLLKV